MEDKNKLTDEVPKNPKKGSGSMLSAARKQQNRSVEEIADELNLSVTQIRTIELDQSEGLPEPTYVRGYIRSYAKLLGLDPNRVLDNYLNPNWQKGSRLDEMPRRIGSANDSDRGGFFSPAKVVSLLLLISIVGFMWLTGKLDGLFGNDEPTPIPAQSTQAPLSSVSSSQTSPDQAASQQGSLNDLSASNESTDPIQSTDPNQLTELQAAAGNQATNEPGTELVSQAGNATSTVHELILNFSDTSWVDIRDGDGKRLAYKSYAEGETLVVSSETKMSVFIGNAKAVTAQYNGQDYDLLPYREGVFARFTIGE